LRCQAAIFSAYRTDQYADPEGFKVQLGAVLEEYPDDVIAHVSDPRTGVQRRSTFPPSISEIVKACDEHAGYLERLSRPRAEPIPREPSPRLKEMPEGYLSQIFVPQSHQRYAGLVAWAEKADRVFWRYGKSSDGVQGIWVDFDTWNGKRGAST
jgi:hypothetical protein